MIDTAQKEALIAADPKAKQFIHRLLRGRDIQKNFANYQGLWIIYIPKGYTIKSQKTENASKVEEPEPRYGSLPYPDAWEWFSQKLPSIAKHLLPYQSVAKQRQDQGDYWWEMRACTYLSEFSNPKIIYPNMTKFMPFLYDTEGYYTNQKCFIMSGEALPYLTAFFNSFLFKYCFTHDFPELQGNTRELNKVIFEQIKIKKITETEQISFDTLMNTISALKKANPAADISKQEAELNAMIYKHYNITTEEQQIIEGRNG